jgi:plastocyanin
MEESFLKRIYRALALASIVAGALASAGPAFAEQKTETFRFPVEVKGYQVKQDISLADHPQVDGSVVAMSVDIVDDEGTPVPINRLMLHHIVFLKAGASPQCPNYRAFDFDKHYPGLAQPFYGAGEERNKLQLPPGYGLPTKADDHWLMTWMLMNHRKVADHAFIEWKVTTDTDPTLKPVTPYWLDVKNCNADPIFNVPGGGAPGSTYSKSYQFNIPESGYIVAAGGHVHGGAKDLRISQPACGDREIMRMDPAWGMPDHPFYHVRPILHEPGPIAVSGYYSSQGFPVAEGQPIKLTADYDDELPHTRVMGISLIYVAHSDTPVNGCAPLPSDVQKVVTPLPHRVDPPRFKVPIVGIGKDGIARDISHPPGKVTKLKSGSRIRVRDFYFSRPRVVVKKGSKLSWDIVSKQPNESHNVTLASGPRGFGSPNHSKGTFRYRFKARGKYRIFCALHPVAMTEVVTVK